METLVEILETSGEHLSEQDLATALGSLLRGRSLEDVGHTMTAAKFSEGVLGF